MSTAALMHDPKRGLPDDAEPLHDSGYFCVVKHNAVVGSMANYMYWNIVDDTGVRKAQIMINLPEERYSRWPYGKPSQLIPASLNPSSPDIDDTNLARAFAEAIELAAEFVDIVNEPLAERIAEIERETKERAEREQREREQREAMRRERAEKRDAAIAEREELVRWYIESKFRLKRRGMRATVFGTIKDVRMGYMSTISEKGKPMRIDLLSIYWLEVKEHEADKKYDIIIDEEERYDPILKRTPESV